MSHQNVKWKKKKRDEHFKGDRTVKREKKWGRSKLFVGENQKSSCKLHQWFEFNLTKHMHDAIFINSSNQFQRKIVSSFIAIITPACTQFFFLAPSRQILPSKRSNFCEKSKFCAETLCMEARSHLGYWCFFINLLIFIYQNVSWY